MMLQRYNKWTTDAELQAVVDAMWARPGGIDAHIATPEDCLDDLRSYLIDPKRYLGAFDRGHGHEAWCRCFPFEQGREALVHIVGKQGGGFRVGLMTEAVGHLIETFFVCYDMQRLTFPVADIPGYPLLQVATEVFAKAGLVKEGVMRRASYTRHQPEPCDLHLWSVLRTDRR